MVEVAPPQDLGEYKAEPVNPQWGAIQPFSIVPDPERLRRPSQRVTLVNTSDQKKPWQERATPQTIIVRDRFEQGHELRPGEKKEMEMVVDDIAYYLREQKMKRKGTDQQIHVHPIVVEDVSEDSIRHTMERWDEEQKAAAMDRSKQSAREQLVELFRDAGITPPAATVSAPQPGEGTQVRRSR